MRHNGVDKQKRNPWIWHESLAITDIVSSCWKSDVLNSDNAIEIEFAIMYAYSTILTQMTRCLYGS